jgi:MFS family permease
MTTTVPVSEASDAGAVRGAIRDTSTALRQVFAHSALRRMQLALVGSMIGDYAYAIAVTVWAYGVGGAKAVGLWAAIRLVIMSITAPLAAGLADKHSRKLVLISADLSRCVTVSAVAGCIVFKGPEAAVFVLASLTSVLGCAFRPAQAAWMPSLADGPEQLTASNAVSSTIESIAVFIGPALGAALIAVAGVQSVFVVDAATFVWSAALIVSITARPDEQQDNGDEDPDAGALATVLAGFREVSHSRDLRLLTALIASQTVVAGASSVFTVLLAVDVLGSGADGVGYLNAVLGVGAVVGGFAALRRSAGNRLGFDLNVGVLLWSVPLLLVVAWPSPVAVYAAVALIGLANPLVDVNFYSAVQSVTPNHVLGRVFGAVEGVLIAMMAAGAASMPYLVDAVGLRTSLAILAVSVSVPVALLLPATRRLDQRLRRPAGLALLQALPIFAPLGQARLESLARHLDRLEVPAGTVIIGEGDRGDLFYVIESGRVSVSRAGSHIRDEGAGDYFGEIALLRDLPRTATVTAVENTALGTLARHDFLDAVAGNGDVMGALHEVVAHRMRF